jgi:hypothetical protein
MPPLLVKGDVIEGARSALMTKTQEAALRMDAIKINWVGHQVSYRGGVEGKFTAIDQHALMLSTI